MSESPERISISTESPSESILNSLRSLIPGAIQDGVIDAQKLAELSGLEVAGLKNGVERFGLMWAGKSKAVEALQAASIAALAPDMENSINWDTAENVFIEGDNLEVLKLLQKAYNDQVKLIYIDPPYNTGNDFVYNDDFSEPLKHYLEVTGQVDSEGNRLVANTEVSGRKHSNWLSMMYPRLVLARNILREDGVIFISIDDNEIAELRLLMDEIFGPENQIAIICHKARASVSNDKIISANHNFILLYARNYESIFNARKEFGIDPDLNGFNKSDEKGEYKFTPVDGPGGAAKGNPHYTFEGVTGYFRYSKVTMQELWDSGEVVKAGNGLQRKYYLEDAMKARKTTTTWWDEGFYSSTATQRLKTFLGGDYFDSPKPIELIQKMLNLHVRTDGDIVLDFFAGSGSTGHAVTEQNAADGVKRKYVLINLPELTADRSSARAAGIEVVSDVTRMRLKQVAMSSEAAQSVGLRCFRLAKSSFLNAGLKLDANALELLSATLDITASDDEIVSETLLKNGIRLDQPWDKSEILGKSVVISDGVAVVLARELSDDICNQALELNAVHTVVFLEDAFAGKDAVKANAHFAFKQANKTLKTI